MTDVYNTPTNQLLIIDSDIINDNLRASRITDNSNRVSYIRNSTNNGTNNGTNKENYNSDNENDSIRITTSIYRYKFTQDFMDELYKFSKIHQFDDRHAFKEAWNLWVEESEELINVEVDRLESLGYEGDVIDKMFKSARYYFRNKGTIKPEPKERRKYIGVQKELLDMMDEHILNNADYKPSEGFDDFCENHKDILKIEVERLLSNNIESSEIMKKIKKTYKNRYFTKISK